MYAGGELNEIKTMIRHARAPRAAATKGAPSKAADTTVVAEHA